MAERAVVRNASRLIKEICVPNGCMFAVKDNCNGSDGFSNSYSCEVVESAPDVVQRLGVNGRCPFAAKRGKVGEVIYNAMGLKGFIRQDSFEK